MVMVIIVIITIIAITIIYTINTINAAAAAASTTNTICQVFNSYFNKSKSDPKVNFWQVCMTKSRTFYRRFEMLATISKHWRITIITVIHPISNMSVHHYECVALCFVNILQ